MRGRKDRKNNACMHTIVRAVLAPTFERGYPIGYFVSWNTEIQGCVV